MSKVIFSSWAGDVVDNRGLDTQKYASVKSLPFPLQYNGHQVRAFMSWNGLVVADDKVNIVDMAHSYLKEVQKLSCGECTVGYNGIKAMTGILDRISCGQGTKDDLDLMQWLGNGIKENTKCDFCASAVTPVLDTVSYYGEEYLKLITGKGKHPQSTYVTRVTAPCIEACPAHQDVPGYVELIRNRRYAEALELIRKTNCFPGVTGRACVAFCEANCVRNDIDSPIAIRALKRVPVDNELASGSGPAFQRIKNGKEKVAVIGAGPAGLAASYNLALKGYKVTIYDEQSSAGGMALIGIPAYRLPKEILEKEADIIQSLGIELKLNTRVGKDITLEQLSSQDFKSIFIATGAHLEREFDIENWKENYGGLIDGVEYLRNVNLGNKVEPKDRVIIVGGGNVAIDCARTCLRLDFKDVAIVYRRSRDEMPGRKEEVEEAEREGVKIHFLAVPVKVLDEGGKVVGAECIRMELGEPDASGRRRPFPIKGSEFSLRADMIISAIGEAPDLTFLSEGKSIDTTEQGTIAVDPFTCQASSAGIFSGGDCVTGPATLVEAIAAGNKAAKSIDQYLRTGKVTLSEEDLIENLAHDVSLSRQRQGSSTVKSTCQSPELLPIENRQMNFDEVEKCFVTEAALKETERCLRCYRVMLLAVSGGS
ncbi:FAD-dependent oxidoreductase [Chloroflexota bacterium]